MTMEIPFCPHVPFSKQIEVLESFDRELFIVGLAGAGKSDVLLMGLLMGVENPDYRGLLVRPSFVELNLPGASLDRMVQWFPSEVTYDAERMKWTFPSGATIKLAYMAKNPPRRHKLGRGYDHIAIDSLNGFQDDDYRFIVRRAKKIGKIRAAVSPEKGWVKDLVLNSPTGTYINMQWSSPTLLNPIVWS